MKNQLRREWELNNFPFYYETTAYILTLLQLALVAGDIAWFPVDRVIYYLPFRVFYAGYFVLTAMYGLTSGLRNRPNAFKIYSSIILFAIISLSLSYNYFLFTAPSEHFSIVLVGNVMVTFASTFYISRFRIISHIYIAFNFILALTFAIIMQTPESSLLICAVVVSGVMAFILQTVETERLLSQYNDHHEMFDPHTSKELTVRAPDLPLQSIFPVKKRAVAVVCCDIRNSQELSVLEDDEVEHIEHGFFDLCKKSADEICKGYRCFTRTHGDEFIAVIFSDSEEDLPELSLIAIQLSVRLATFVHEAVNRDFKSGFLFDVGVSWGFNRLGFLGSSGTKKPDIRGNVVIEAKRFQEEAKVVRKTAKEAREEINYPIIITRPDAPVVPLTSYFAKKHSRSAESRIDFEKVNLYKRSS